MSLAAVGVVEALNGAAFAALGQDRKLDDQHSAGSALVAQVENRGLEREFGVVAVDASGEIDHEVRVALVERIDKRNGEFHVAGASGNDQVGVGGCGGHTSHLSTMPM